MAVAYGSILFIDSPEADDYNFSLAVNQCGIMALGLVNALRLLFRNSDCLSIDKGERDEFIFPLRVLQELDALWVEEFNCLFLDFCAECTSFNISDQTARCLSDRYVLFLLIVLS